MKIFVIGLLVASATMVSAQGLLNRGGLNRLNRLGRNTGVNAAASRTPSSIGVSSKEADELAEKIAAAEMQGRIKGILDEPTPVKLEEFPFREAVMKAKAGEAEGYFALAYHYAAGIEVARSSDKAWHLLKRAADKNHPLATLIFAMAEEGRMLDQGSRSGAWLGDLSPHIEKYLSDSQRPGFWPLIFTSDEEQELFGHTGRFFQEFKGGTSTRLESANSNDVVYVRGLYDRGVALNVRGAKTEIDRFDARIEGLSLKTSDDVRRKGNLQANAQLIEEALGIPVESRGQIWDKVCEEKNRKERMRQTELEERVNAIEQQLREKGMLK